MVGIYDRDTVVFISMSLNVIHDGYDYVCDKNLISNFLLFLQWSRILWSMKQDNCLSTCAQAVGQPCQRNKCIALGSAWNKPLNILNLLLTLSVILLKSEAITSFGCPRDNKVWNRLFLKFSNDLHRFLIFKLFPTISTTQCSCKLY